MKTAIATSEFHGTNAAGERARLTVAVGAPVRNADAESWHCRIAVADVMKPTAVTGRDSFDALDRAMRRVFEELDELRKAGWTLESVGANS